MVSQCLEFGSSRAVATARGRGREGEVGERLGAGGWKEEGWEAGEGGGRRGGGGERQRKGAVEEFPNSGDIWLADSGQVEQADLHTGTKPTCKTDRPAALHCAHRHSGMLPTLLPAALFVWPACLVYWSLCPSTYLCLSRLLVSLSIYLPVSV